MEGWAGRGPTWTQRPPERLPGTGAQKRPPGAIPGPPRAAGPGPALHLLASRRAGRKLVPGRRRGDRQGGRPVPALGASAGLSGVRPRRKRRGEEVIWPPGTAAELRSQGAGLGASLGSAELGGTRVGAGQQAEPCLSFPAGAVERVLPPGGRLASFPDPARPRISRASLPFPSQPPATRGVAPRPGFPGCWPPSLLSLGTPGSPGLCRHRAPLVALGMRSSIHSFIQTLWGTWVANSFRNGKQANKRLQFPCSEEEMARRHLREEMV